MHGNYDHDDSEDRTLCRSVKTRGVAVIAVALPFALACPACSTEATKRAAYEALYQKDCLDRTGVPQCDPEHKDYDQYRQERDETLNPDSSAKSD